MYLLSVGFIQSEITQLLNTTVHIIPYTCSGFILWDKFSRISRICCCARKYYDYCIAYKVWLIRKCMRNTLMPTTLKNFAHEINPLYGIIPSCTSGGIIYAAYTPIHVWMAKDYHALSSVGIHTVNRKTSTATREWQCFDEPEYHDHDLIFSF